MGFRRRTQQQLEELRAELASVRAQAAAAEAQAAEAAATRPEPEPLPPIEPPDHFPLPPPGPGTSLADVKAALDLLVGRVDRLDGRHARDTDEVRARLDEVAVALTNQLGELSGEIEATQAQLRAELAAHAGRLEELAAQATALAASTPDPADDERLATLLAELRANQVRIANDLARHEIAIRQDLASLAQLVHRPPAR